MLEEEIAKVKDKKLKGVLNDIVAASKDYIKQEHMPRAVINQLDAVEMFLYSPFLQQVAQTSRIMFEGVNENKLSRLYSALAQYTETKTLPQNYERTRSIKLDSMNSSDKPASEPQPTALAVA